MLVYKRTLTLLILAGVGLLGTLPAEAANPFLGNWALKLPGDGAGWLSVHQEKDYLEGEVLWYGGSVVPVGAIYMAEDRLIVIRHRDVVRTKDEDGKPLRVHKVPIAVIMEAYGDTLSGQIYDPANDGTEVNTSSLTGKRIPPPPAAPDLSKVKFGDPVKLFNGKNLDGWKPKEPNNKNGWSAKDGVLVNNPVQTKGQPHIRYANLQTTDKYEDFNLQLEVNVPKGSNSGIYLRGIYEVQVSDSHGQPLDSHNMGAIYSRITPTMNAEKPAGQWQKFDITLCDRHVTVVLNGKKIVDNRPLLGCTGGAITADEFIPGPIYLQGDHGEIHYRNVVLKPIVK